MPNIKFFAQEDGEGNVFSEFSYDVPEFVFNFFIDKSYISGNNFARSITTEERQFIVITENGNVVFTNRSVIELDRLSGRRHIPHNRRKYVDRLREDIDELLLLSGDMVATDLDLLNGKPFDWLDDNITQREREFMYVYCKSRKELAILSRICRLMEREDIKFMQVLPGANDFDNENFAIGTQFGIKDGEEDVWSFGALFEFRNNQIFINWEGEKTLITETIVKPNNLLASCIHAIAEANRKSIISPACYDYFIDIIVECKMEFEVLEP